MTPFMWHVETVARNRCVMQACCRAAQAFAHVCPPEAIEDYVRTCASADRQARWCDMLVSIISAFAPPAIFLGVDGPYGLIAGIIFIAAWAFVGLDQCMTHISRVQTERVTLACATLARAASIKIVLPDAMLLYPQNESK